MEWFVSADDVTLFKLFLSISIPASKGPYGKDNKKQDFYVGIFIMLIESKAGVKQIEFWVLGMWGIFSSLFFFFFLRKGLFSSLQYWMWWFFCLRLWRRCHPKQSDCDNPHYPHNILADVQPVLSWAKLLHTHASLQNSKWWITSEPYPQNWSLQ